MIPSHLSCPHTSSSLHREPSVYQIRGSHALAVAPLSLYTFGGSRHRHCKSQFPSPTLTWLNLPQGEGILCS